MKINLTRIKQEWRLGKFYKDGIIWLASDDNNHTGTGESMEKAVGDLVLSYHSPVKTEDDKYELEINQP